MSKPKFADIFTGEFLGYVAHYCERIQEIINEYDVVIFMARKSVCFYKAMSLNGELIVPPSCNILSSRIITYNVLEKYKGKKIAVVDDVVVKGESLKRVISKLNEYSISADILVVACDETMDIKTYIKQYKNLSIYDTYVVLKQKDIFSFAGMITEYIEASMCPFNIDYPIYTLDIKDSALNEFLYMNHAIDITSGTQQHYCITNNVIYLTINHIIPDDSPLFLLNNSILKIRILSDGVCTIAVPFVLFPELTNDDLERIFSLIKTNNIMKLVEVDNELIMQENKIKIISYFLSEIIINSFFRAKDITIKKQDDNDIFQFTENTYSLLENVVDNLYKNYNLLLNSFSSIYVEYSKFKFSNLLALCYQAILEIDISKQYFTNYDGNLIDNEIIITYEIISQKIKSDSINNTCLASCIIDILIDRGMFVPSIVHTKSNGIIRAYKLGEYSKLTRSQIESFAAMLYQYQDMIGDSLNKTEFEKLCVLFFKMAIARGIFTQQEKYEDGCYSICYSLYGPRVSTSVLSYRVSTDSALVTDFCNPINPKNKLAIEHKGKYTINIIGTLNQQKDFTSAFAFQYSALRKAFINAEAKRKENKSEKTSWNMYVHTYIQYLTLRAIGNSKKNQFLSLCAELYQVSLLPEKFFELDEENKLVSERVLSGIDSGLWKYWCFSNDALDKTTQQVFEKDNYAGALILLDQEQPGDNKEEWQIAINNAGELLYKIAFFINKVLEVKHKVNKLSISGGISESKEESREAKKTLFSSGSYYNSDENIKNMRHSIEETIEKHLETPDFNNWCEIELKKLKQAAKLQLDICDVILINNNPSVTYFTKYLIVYSKNGFFPKQFSSVDIYEQELKLDGIVKNSNVKIFGLSADQKALPLLSKLFTGEKQESLRWLVLDLDDPNLITFKNKKNKYGKGSIIASRINEIIKQYENEETENDLFVVSPKPYPSTITHNNIQLDSLSSAQTQIDLSPIVNKLSECFPLASDGKQMIINQFTIVANHINIGNNNKSTVNIINFNSELNNFKQELEQFITKADEKNKKILEEALTAINQKDEGKFTKAIKEAGSFLSGVASKIAASVIFEFMKQKGLLP